MHIVELFTIIFHHVVVFPLVRIGTTGFFRLTAGRRARGRCRAILRSCWFPALVCVFWRLFFEAHLVLCSDTFFKERTIFEWEPVVLECFQSYQSGTLFSMRDVSIYWKMSEDSLVWYWVCYLDFCHIPEWFQNVTSCHCTFTHWH